MNFRELTRKKQALSREECIRILTEETRGVLSVNGDGGYPYGAPMNHVYNGADGCVYFHCGRVEGHRLSALRQDDRVSFCVCQQTERVGWVWRLHSVVVFGRMEILDDPDAVLRIAPLLCRKFTDDEAYIQRELKTSARGTLLLRLVPEHICGKAVKEE